MKLAVVYTDRKSECLKLKREFAGKRYKTNRWLGSLMRAREETFHSGEDARPYIELDLGLAVAGRVGVLVRAGVVGMSLKLTWQIVAHGIVTMDRSPTRGMTPETASEQGGERTPCAGPPSSLSSVSGRP